MVCAALDVTSTIGLFFSFFEVKNVESKSWVAISGVPRNSFLQTYTTNYKGFKDRFLRVRCGPRCPQVIYATDGHMKFPLYWTTNPLPISRFNHDKLSDTETQSLQVLDSFLLFKVKDLLPLPDKEALAFLGKAPFISSLPMDLLVLSHMFLFDVFADKMTDLSVKE